MFLEPQDRAWMEGIHQAVRQFSVNIKYSNVTVKRSVSTSKETPKQNVFFSEGGSLSFATQKGTELKMHQCGCNKTCPKARLSVRVVVCRSRLKTTPD